MKNKTIEVDEDLFAALLYDISEAAVKMERLEQENAGYLSYIGSLEEKVQVLEGDVNHYQDKVDELEFELECWD